MSLKLKRTVFPQQKIRRNFSSYSDLRKSLNPTDAVVFFMLADATCSIRPKVDIEKIHVDIFKRKKIVVPKISKGDLETLEILKDPQLMQELKKSKKETRQGRLTSWKKVRIQT